VGSTNRRLPIRGGVPSTGFARAADRYFELKSQIHRKLRGVLNLERVSSLPKDRRGNRARGRATARRKILSISEVLGVRDDKVQLQEIFTFERTGVTDAGKVQGRFRATAAAPKLPERLRVSGIHLPQNTLEEVVPVNL